MKKLLVGLLAAWSLNVGANQTVNDTQTWVPVNINYKFGETNWRGFLELQPRISHNSSELGAAIVRPAIGYAISPNATLWAGYLMQATEDGFTYHYLIENRAFQGLTWKDTALDKQFIWEVRNRFEERFLPHNDDVSLRWRTRIRGEYIIPQYKAVSLIASDEIFVTLNDNDTNRQLEGGWNQNRAYVGVGYRFFPEFQVETGYLNQYTPGHYGKANSNNNVWMTNLNFNF